MPRRTSGHFGQLFEGELFIKVRLYVGCDGSHVPVISSQFISMFDRAHDSCNANDATVPGTQADLGGTLPVDITGSNIGNPPSLVENRFSAFHDIHVFPAIGISEVTIEKIVVSGPKYLFF